MTMFIVHRGTATVINAHECAIVDISDEVLDSMTGDDYFDDQVVLDLAEQNGRPVVTDLLPRNTVAFSPSAIREELSYILDNRDDDDPERPMLEWAMSAGDEHLASVADWILGSDDFWDGMGFTSWITDGVRTVHRQVMATK